MPMNSLGCHKTDLSLKMPKGHVANLSPVGNTATRLHRSHCDDNFMTLHSWYTYKVSCKNNRYTEDKGEWDISQDLPAIVPLYYTICFYVICSSLSAVMVIFMVDFTNFKLIKFTYWVCMRAQHVSTYFYHRLRTISLRLWRWSTM